MGRVTKQFIIQYYVDSGTDDNEDEENDDSSPSPPRANVISDAHKSEYCSYLNYTVGREKSLQVNLPLPFSRNKNKSSSTAGDNGDEVKVKRLAVIIKETTPPEINVSASVPRRPERTKIAGRSSTGSMVEVTTKEKKKAAAMLKAKVKKRYRSSQRILLVGEGDFSFSACLAEAFGSASYMVATSLDSQAFLEENYGSAKTNIEKLKSRGSKVMHEIDATKMADHALLGQLKFDRIIFNFPFAGFFGSLSPEHKLRRHRRLISLFLKNAKQMISEDGEIHVSHKTSGAYVEWNLESIASSHGLRLIAAVKFQPLDYPGYNTKYGFGGDGNFNCYPCQTYKFGLKILDSKQPSSETSD